MLYNKKDLETRTTEHHPMIIENVARLKCDYIKEIFDT